MQFIYAIIVGIAFGFSDLTVTQFIAIIFIITSLHAIKDILIKKSFISDVTSPYQLYLLNLDELKKPKANAAIKYYIQALLIDSLIALVAFALTRSIR